MMKIMMTLTVLAIVAAFSACGGDDNPNPPCDETQEDCQPAPDAGGVANSDATPPAAPDATYTNPCEGYEWLEGTVWNCGGPDNCTMSVAINDMGQCVTGCTGSWGGLAVSDMVISADRQHLTYPFTCDRLL